MVFSTAPFATLRHAGVRIRLQRSTSRSQLSVFRRLLSSLAVLEQKDGKLNMSSLAAISAAQKLGDSVTGFVAGGGVKSVADAAAKVQGIEKIIFVDNAAYDRVRSNSIRCRHSLTSHPAPYANDPFEVGSTRELCSITC